MGLDPGYRMGCKVAVVDGGLVPLVGSGRAVITAQAMDGGKKEASVTLNVTYRDRTPRLDHQHSRAVFIEQINLPLLLHGKLGQGHRDLHGQIVVPV